MGDSKILVLGLFAIIVGSIAYSPIQSALASFDPPITIDNPNPSIQQNNFGQSVSTSDQFILVGASGSAYLFDTSGNLLQTYNSPSITPETFGGSVSIDGDKVIIGARGDSTVNTSAGSAYLFDTSGNLLQTYNDPFGGLVDQFGTSVSISGDKILVGAHRTLSTTEGGRAYLFDTSGNLLQTYNNPSPGSGDRFGFSVSLSGDKVLVGDHFNDLIGFDEGSAYLFDTSGNLLQTYDNPFPSNVARFGSSVSVLGDKVLIGSPFFEGIFGPPGDAYLFDTSGNLLQTYNSPSITTDFFGGSVSLSGENVLIGAFEGNTGVDRSGVVYLYDTSNNLLEIFENPTPAFRDKFGISVSLSPSGNVAVGAPGDDDTTPNAGAVYFFIGNSPPDCSNAIPNTANSVDSFDSGVVITSSSSTPVIKIESSPSHKTVEIGLSGVTDPDGDPTTLTIDGITQDEPTTGSGKGDKSPDGFGVGTDTATIRAERLGTGDGRVYEISFTADDGNGGICSGSVFVAVPHDNKKDPIDSGQNFDSTQP